MNKNKSKLLFIFAILLAAGSVARAQDVNSLRVFIEPVDITFGDGYAQWMCSYNHVWNDSGVTIPDIPYGTYVVGSKPYPGYYTPPNYNVVIHGTNMIFTNVYLPWTNQFSVTVVDENTNNMANAQWRLTHHPSTFTNYTRGTGTLDVVMCPTGRYDIAFSNVPGYTRSPASSSLTIEGGTPAAFTSVYTRATGNILISLSPTNASWRFVEGNYPEDITNFTESALSGTGPATITNAPSGTYEIQFDYLPGFQTPPNQTHIINNFDHTITGFYGRGHSVRIHVYQPEELIYDFATGEYIYCTGIGTGTYTLSGDPGFFDEDSSTWYFASNSVVTFRAHPEPMEIDGVEYNSFFFEWDGYTNSLSNPMTLTIRGDMEVRLLFSREYYPWDNVGDLDQDGLPDEWERRWGLDPKNPSGIHGRYGNPSGDYIPSASSIPPTLFSMNTNHASSYMGAGSVTPGYPLRGLALERGYNNSNPDNAVPFNNWLQCRGLDGYYGTNVPPGEPAVNDDPMTDPLVADTSDNSLPDGWSYYFWYWRSASSYAAGITNSANLDWVRISPSMARAPTIWSPADDTDGDWLSDREEYLLGTDPTHADTDGDGTDDFWEAFVFPETMNPLVRDGHINPDNDWYAVSTRTRVLTNDTPGTAFAEDVLHNGNMSAVWVDVDGTGEFDLYRDTVLHITPGFVMTDGMAGDLIADPVLYGTNDAMGIYLSGYPVWVDRDGDGTYSDGDTDIFNPFVKHNAVYCEAPANPGPGVSSFNPLVGWDALQDPGVTNIPPQNRPYVAYQEYMGGDFMGRVSWDAGGRVIAEHVDPYELTINCYTDPGNPDTDGDGMPDGWELYVGLNPNDPGDANDDPDDDDLTNVQEWANWWDPTGRDYYAWDNENKPWPTDPGVVVAPPPNDPHPADTDWDGVADGAERAAGTNPTTWDTDGDGLPDGWELYAGSDPLVSDAREDPDGDGLLNYQEYWTGTVPEWQLMDPAWNPRFITRRAMEWDPVFDDEIWTQYFMPPHFQTCPSFRYVNNINTDLADLRENFPASNAWGSAFYQTTRADEPDSDGDGMDDFWEVYHGLNPLRGRICLAMPENLNGTRFHVLLPAIAREDARPDLDWFQFGLPGTAFTSLAQYMDYYDAVGPFATWDLVGPFNFGLPMMDPDGDGLPNLDEYSYNPERAVYNTDPTPLWRTCEYLANSFVNRNYGFDIYGDVGFIELGWVEEEGTGVFMLRYPFHFGMNEGFDTDGDMVGDYDEINKASGLSGGTDPLDPRNPMRNRALRLNGTRDFARTLCTWSTISDNFLTRFCVEAWVRPTSATIAKDTAIITEKAAMYPNPYDQLTIFRINFSLGLANGRPFIMYNGMGAGTRYQATAAIRHKLEAGKWAHLAGVYDGTHLTIYVNGEVSATLRTTELPATGFSFGNVGVPNTLIVGARDLTPGINAAYNTISTEKHFGGYIDQVRVWDGRRTRAQVREYMDKRIHTHELTDPEHGRLVHYYSFDDVADPDIDGIVPEGLDALDTNLRFHPTLDWWADHSQRSRIYTGSAARPYNYIVTAQDHVAHKPIVPPMDDRINMIWTTNANGRTASLPEDYRNPSNPYPLQYAGNSGNLTKDLYLFYGARGVRPRTTWLPIVDPDNTDSVDSSGDGMPDWWKIEHGLDPHSAEGDDGPWGDPDGDGLHNLAEYLAGTDPWQWDTSGDGLSDFDSRDETVPYALTWGELYTSMDPLPALWKAEHGLDPHSYTAHKDSDGDGWSNYAEYQAGTDPSDPNSFPRPVVSGPIIYNGRHDIARYDLIVLGYQTNTMDGTHVRGRRAAAGEEIPVTEVIGTGDGQRKEFSGQLLHGNIVRGSVGVRRLNPAIVTPDYDFRDDAGGNWRFYPDYTSSVDGSDYVDFDYVTGEYTFAWPDGDPNFWGAPWSGDTIFIDYRYADVSGETYVLTGLREGDLYIFAFIDIDGSGEWRPGEPAGLATEQPVRLSWGNISGLAIGLSDDKPGYGRFRWTIPPGSNTVAVSIKSLSNPGAPQVLSRSVRAPRNYFHEWDYLLKGIRGLETGSYQWWAGTQSGTFVVNWPSAQNTPYIVHPRGDNLIYARNRIGWLMDSQTTAYRLQIFDGALQLVVDDYFTAPYPDEYGIYWDNMPYDANDLGNGTYFWRLAGSNPKGDSEWSDWQSFNINLSKETSSTISGSIYYFGKVAATNIVVQAFDNAGFSGVPKATVTRRQSGTGNPKATFTLRGLRDRVYYVRAFIDTRPAGGAASGREEFWSTAGFVPAPEDIYKPRALDMRNASLSSNNKIVLRDKDTDNDKMPDAWEVQYFGNLDQTAEMDYDGDGESNLYEYMILGSDPSVWDTARNGLSDGFARRYGGDSKVYDPYCPRFNPKGRDLHVLRRSTDRSGYSDGAQLRRYRTDPLDPRSVPEYMPECYGSRPAPADYDGDGRSDFTVYDLVSGDWHIFTWYGDYREFQFGDYRTRPMPSDFAGDGISDVAVYDPDSGYWYIYTSAGQFIVLPEFGTSDMIPVPGDYDGNWKTDFALYDPTSGYWFIYTWNGQFTMLEWGGPNAVPVPGDYNRDGRNDFAVYCQDSGYWFILTWDYQFYMVQFGGGTFIPVPGDYDGDDRNDFAVFDTATGFWYIVTWTGEFRYTQFGWPGAVPVPGDYSGDGRTDLAVYCPDSGYWFVYCWSGDFYVLQFGGPNFSPVLRSM